MYDSVINQSIDLHEIYQYFITFWSYKHHFFDKTELFFLHILTISDYEP